MTTKKKHKKKPTTSFVHVESSIKGNRYHCTDCDGEFTAGPILTLVQDVDAYKHWGTTVWDYCPLCGVKCNCLRHHGRTEIQNDDGTIETTRLA